MSRVLWAAAMAACFSAAGLSGPIGIHWHRHALVPGGPIFDDVWVFSDTWLVAGGAFQIVDNPDLITGWELQGPGEILALAMFDLQAMNGMMQPLFSRGVGDLTFAAVQIERSSAQILPSLVMTMRTCTLSGPSFEMRLAEPVSVGMTLSGFTARPDGLFLAHYEGVAADARFFVRDPFFGPGEWLAFSEGGQPIGVDILTRVPAPGCALGMMIGALGLRRRARAGV